jgi:hypothetical protein
MGSCAPSPFSRVRAFSGSMPDATAKAVQRASHRPRNVASCGKLKCAATKGAPGLSRRRAYASVRRRPSRSMKCSVREKLVKFALLARDVAP